MFMNSVAEQPDLAVVFPHLAPSDKDAATVALLAAQSRQLVADLAPALSRLIELVPSAHAATSLLDAVPQLLLKFYPMNKRREWTPVEIPSILQAFAMLARHSQQLNAFPALKTQFWLDVLSSQMAHEVTRDVTKSEFMRPTFPAFVVDFGGYRPEPLIIDQALEDALVAFMTTPVASPLSSESSASLSFGFVFRHCSLRVATLESLERFLDRSFASTTRQFDLRMLEVSNDYLMPPDLAVLARIVDKCVHNYGVEDLRLDEIAPGVGGGPRADWVYPKTTPAPLLAIARSVFAVDALPALTSRPSLLTPSRSRLRRLSMSKNYYCLELFAMRFSSLRYGSSLEADTTTYVAKNSYVDVDYKTYWRWLAFGRFYPRPKRFASQFRLRNIGHVEHCPLSAKVFARTLRNPAAELIFGGKNELGGTKIEPTTELLVCIVKAGASVDVFQTGNASTPEWTDTFATECELEAIYESEDVGAVCVVVPGVGLGWVQAEAVKRIEREPLSSTRSEQDGLFAGDLGWDTQWRADNNSMWDVPSLQASMTSMVETFGRQFHALSFGHHTFPNGFLPVLLQHCTRLTHLSLYSQKVLRHGSDVLLDALGGPLGDRLQVLNLNYFGTTTNAFYERLFSILSDTDDPPALREIRLGGHFLNLKQLEALYRVLQVNSTLALVEVHTHRSGLGVRKGDQIEATTTCLNADFHGQLLRGALPLVSRLAFLSVVKRRGDSAIKALDSWGVGNIFAFAGEHELRRTLVWNEVIQPATNPHQIRRLRGVLRIARVDGIFSTLQ